MEVSMKNLMLTLALASAAFLSTTVQACEQQEAQFIGNVKNHSEIQRSETTSECFYEIEYSMFNSSFICPLDIDEVLTEHFQDYECKLKNGDQVSGVIVKLNDKIILE
jgi:hypothetical protein